MTRRRTSLLLGALAGAVGTAGALGAADAGPAVASHPPARMLVYAQEWSLWPSRSALPAGRVVVQLWNRGQDPHDLRVRRLGAGGAMIGRPQEAPVTESGQIRTASWNLPPGTYELYCGMPGHLKLGMRTRLVVR